MTPGWQEFLPIFIIMILMVCVLYIISLEDRKNKRKQEKLSSEIKTIIQKLHKSH